MFDSLKNKLESINKSQSLDLSAIKIGTNGALYTALYLKRNTAISTLKLSKSWCNQ